MKLNPRKPSLTYNPFEDIKGLLREKSISLPAYRQPDIRADVQAGIQVPGFEHGEESEERLFNEAMEGVKPISREKCGEGISQIKLPEGLPENFNVREDAETLSKLTALVKYGTGFNVFETPEYIEGTGYHVHPEIARRLHRGDYSIQAHVDLHGLTAHDAEEIFEKFLKWAVMTGKSGLLIIHGRGLSSPSEPVLKKKVVEWLTRGPWRKWVIAYSSARRCDGGAGATYVLLRKRPVSKRFKRRVKHPSE
jgi:DNA-nicking Smr family endonuclease